MKRTLAVVTAALALVALAGCGSFLETKQPVFTTYVLSAPDAEPRAQRIAADLAVGMPGVAPGLESERITVLRGREMDYYSAAKWGAPVSRLVQALMVRTLTRQQAFQSVAAEDIRIDSEFLLDIEVTDFQAEYTGAVPTVRVGYIGRLIEVSTREPLDAIVVEATAAADQNRLGSVVAAFEQAAQQAALQLTERASTAAEQRLARK